MSSFAVVFPSERSPRSRRCSPPERSGDLVERVHVVLDADRRAALSFRVLPGSGVFKDSQWRKKTPDPFLLIRNGTAAASRTAAIAARRSSEFTEARPPRAGYRA